MQIVVNTISNKEAYNSSTKNPDKMHYLMREYAIAYYSNTKNGPDV
jgi:hypothetical protein